MNNNAMDEIKKINWHKLDAGIVDIRIKGKTLSDVYGRYSEAKRRSYWYCIDKVYKFINNYSLLLINYGITGCNSNSYTFEFLLKDELGNKYLIVETAWTSKYYTSNERLIRASRRYRKTLNVQK